MFNFSLEGEPSLSNSCMRRVHRFNSAKYVFSCLVGYINRKGGGMHAAFRPISQF